MGDALKGWLAVFAAANLAPALIGAIAILAAGLMAFLGHLFPVFLASRAAGRRHRRQRADRRQRLAGLATLGVWLGRCLTPRYSSWLPSARPSLHQPSPRARARHLLDPRLQRDVGPADLAPQGQHQSASSPARKAASGKKKGSAMTGFRSPFLSSGCRRTRRLDFPGRLQRGHRKAAVGDLHLLTCHQGMAPAKAIIAPLSVHNSSSG